MSILEAVGLLCGIAALAVILWARSHVRDVADQAAPTDEDGPDKTAQRPVWRPGDGNNP